MMGRVRLKIAPDRVSVAMAMVQWGPRVASDERIAEITRTLTVAYGEHGRRQAEWFRACCLEWRASRAGERWDA